MSKTNSVKVSITTNSGAVVEASLCEGRVTISQNGSWAGDGNWSASGIVDCSARLGAPDGSETEAAYDALDLAIGDALDELDEADTCKCSHCGHPIAPEGVTLPAADDVDLDGEGRARCSDSACVAA